jgi:hypothetical protein
MASGAVQTPAGMVNPAIRFSRGCQPVPAKLPSNGTVFPLGVLALDQPRNVQGRDGKFKPNK